MKSFLSRLARAVGRFSPGARRNWSSGSRASVCRPCSSTSTPSANNRQSGPTRGPCFARAGVEVVSGMFRTVGEDYSSPATIRVTGGFVPDATWDENWRNLQTTVEDRPAVRAEARDRSTPASCRTIRRTRPSPSSPSGSARWPGCLGRRG